MVYASRQAHICRAMLEAIAFQTGDVVGAMEKDLQAARCSHCQTSSNPRTSSKEGEGYCNLLEPHAGP